MLAPKPGAVVLAWLISVAWHAGLFAVMILTAWLADLADEQDSLPLAHTDLLGDLVDTRLNISTETALNDPIQIDKTALPKIEPKKFELLTKSVSAARPELSIVGIGTGGGNDFSKYGLRASAGGPGPNFFGIGQKARGARRIVYVVDRSGSMLTTFDAVRKELRRSIQGLRRSQKFHVIFFNAGDPLENRPKKLVPANGRQKQVFFDFVKTIQPEGSTDPIPAMRRALAVKPDLIYFLTDGDFDPLLIEVLADWNQKQKVRIFTIAYVSQAGSVLLEQIARENGGEFKFVSEHELY